MLSLQQQAEKRSRLNVLEQLQIRSRRIQRRHTGGLEAMREQVLGSLADKIRVPDQYITAIETALGHHLQLVLTEAARSRAANSGRSAAPTKKAAPASLRWHLRELHRAQLRRGTHRRRIPNRFERALKRDASVQPLLQRLLGQHVDCRRSRCRHQRLARSQRRIRFCHPVRRIAEPSRRLHRRFCATARARRPLRFSAAKIRSPNCRRSWRRCRNR